MPVIATSNHPKALWPGVKGFWGRSYDDHQTEFTNDFDVEQSDQAYEELVQITGFGLVPVKNQGKAAVFDSTTQGLVTRFVNVAYALGYIVTHEEIQDNLYLAVSKTRASSLARSFRQTKERVHANIYNRASDAGYPLADGVPLLSNAHPTALGGTYSNVLSTPAALSEASLEDMCIQLMGAVDDRGLTINLMPQSLHIPPALQFDAYRILKTDRSVGNDYNDINAVRAMGVIPKGVFVNHYYTAPAAWFVRTNIERGRGLVSFEREGISFTQDNDFATKNALSLGYERYSCGVGDARALFGSTG